MQVPDCAMYTGGQEDSENGAVAIEEQALLGEADYQPQAEEYDDSAGDHKFAENIGHSYLVNDCGISNRGGLGTVVVRRSQVTRALDSL